VNSEREKLNARIRQTITNLHDEDLLHVARSTSGEYTRFALEVAKAEMDRRGGAQALTQRLKQHSAGKTPGEITFVRASRLQPKTARPSSGCYIEVWRDKDFEGESLVIEGPGEITDLCSNHMNWCGSIKSIRVGPHAFVLAYCDKEFKGKGISLGPSEEVADLGDIKFDDEIDSIQIVDSIKVFDCTSSPDLHLPKQVASETAGLEVPGKPETRVDELGGAPGHPKARDSKKKD
jgi:hypothetical protein